MGNIVFDTGIIGGLRISEEGNVITRIEFLPEVSGPEKVAGSEVVSGSEATFGTEATSGTGGIPGTEKNDFSPVLEKARTQLMEYLRGEREEFTFPIRMKGTVFQEDVWTTLLDIPYGETCSYRELAERIGNPKACRAVGMANNRNHLPIVIPCHRVVGSDGRMIGYGGGIWIKKKLLSIERTRNLSKVFVRE